MVTYSSPANPSVQNSRSESMAERVSAARTGLHELKTAVFVALLAVVLLPVQKASVYLYPDVQFWT